MGTRWNISTAPATSAPTSSWLKKSAWRLPRRKSGGAQVVGATTPSRPSPRSHPCAAAPSDASPNALATSGSTKRLVTRQDRKSTRLNSSHVSISYAVFCLKKKKKQKRKLDKKTTQ